jgi:hypothetical protein
MSKTDIGDLVSHTVLTNITLCRNNPELEFAVLASAAAFAAVSAGATEKEAMKYFQKAFRMATLGREAAKSGGIQ